MFLCHFGRDVTPFIIPFFGSLTDEIMPPLLLFSSEFGYRLTLGFDDNA